MRLWPLLLLALAATVVAAPDDPEYKTRRILGWVEAAVIAPDGPAVRLKAKLDTGAKTSSLHATAIEAFEREGDDWVRFEVPLTDHLDIEADELDVEHLTFERRVDRTVRIKSAGDSDGSKRYVVAMDVCLGGVEYRGEFTLSDRRGLMYPVLLGRRLLEERVVVDPAYSFLAPRACEHTDADELEPDSAVDAPTSDSD